MAYYMQNQGRQTHFAAATAANVRQSRMVGYTRKTVLLLLILIQLTPFVVWVGVGEGVGWWMDVGVSGCRWVRVGEGVCG